MLLLGSIILFFQLIEFILGDVDSFFDNTGVLSIGVEEDTVRYFSQESLKTASGGSQLPYHSNFELFSLVLHVV
jgi:hypothetical protein